MENFTKKKFWRQERKLLQWKIQQGKNPGGKKKNCCSQKFSQINSRCQKLTEINSCSQTFPREISKKKKKILQSNNFKEKFRKWKILQGKSSEGRKKFLQPEILTGKILEVENSTGNKSWGLIKKFLQSIILTNKSLLPKTNRN